MEINLKKGVFEIYVLSVLYDGDNYGYEVCKELQQSVCISESTLYPILNRLLKKEMLISYEKIKNGRLRKYYKITQLGKNRVIEFIKEFEEVNNNLSFIKNKIMFKQLVNH